MRAFNRVANHQVLLCRQRGAALVLAMFVLVVLAGLGASMTRLIGSGLDSTAREVVSSRAFLAAESGAQRMLNHIFLDANCAAINNWQPSNSGLSGCRIDASCSATVIDGVSYYDINSTGRCGPSNARSVRMVSIQARD